MLNKITSEKIIIYALALMPFLVIVDSASILSPRILIVWILGLSSLILLPKQKTHLLINFVSLLAIFTLAASLLSDQIVLYIFGASNFGLGVLTLLSVVMVSLFVSKRLEKDEACKAVVLYAAVLGLVSILFDLESVLSGQRLSGVVGNSALLGILLGIGAITSIYMHSRKIKLKYHPVYFSVISISLLLTQTRAAILPLLILGVLMYLRPIVSKPTNIQKAWKTNKKSFLGPVVFATLLFAIGLSSGRTFNTSYLWDSVDYRIEILEHSIETVKGMPFWGFGPGRIEDALYQSGPLPEVFQSSYDENVIIESSHNIFVDYLLSYGWLVFILFAAYMLTTVYFSYLLIKAKEYHWYVFVFLYVLFQQQFTVAWLETDIVLWASSVAVWNRYVILRRGNIPRVEKFSSKHIILMCIIVVVVQLGVDRAIVGSRVEREFVFPIASSQQSISEAPPFKGVSAIWDSSTQTSLHEPYPAADIFIEPGSTVVAAKSGRVISVRDNGCDGMNQFPSLYIRGWDGLTYYYAHLESGSLSVQPGDIVVKGQPIGSVGVSDCSSGTPPHLHFDISYFYSIRSRSDSFMQFVNYIDPQPALTEAFKNLDAY